jgi:hypothetical protein
VHRREPASELVHIGVFVAHEAGTIDHYRRDLRGPDAQRACKYAAYDGLRLSAEAQVT